MYSNARDRFFGAGAGLDTVEATFRSLPRVAPTPAEQEFFERTLSNLFGYYPFLGAFASSEAVRYHTFDGAKMPIALTDGMAVYLNRAKGKFFDLPYEQAVFVLAHEVMHIAREDTIRMYILRMRKTVPIPKNKSLLVAASRMLYGRRDAEDRLRELRKEYPNGLPYKRKLYNIAADASINDGLVTERVGVIPKGAIRIDFINSSMDTLVAYTLLHLRRDASRDVGDSSGGDGFGEAGEAGSGDSGGDGSGDLLYPGEAGDPDAGHDSPGAGNPIPAHVAMQKIAEMESARNIAFARAANCSRMMGTGSTKLYDTIVASKAAAVDWRKYFEGWVARAIGFQAFDPTRPYRRDALRDFYGLGDPFFSPSRAGHGCNRIVVAVDTSGSITKDELRMFCASISDVLEELNPREGVHLVFCDSQVQKSLDVAPGDDIASHFVLGGGTDFRPVFRHVAETLDNECDGLIYFTDLYGSFPASPPPYPVLWVSTTEASAPWGEVVTVDPARL